MDKKMKVFFYLMAAFFLIILLATFMVVKTDGKGEVKPKQETKAEEKIVSYTVKSEIEITRDSEIIDGDIVDLVYVNFIDANDRHAKTTVTLDNFVYDSPDELYLRVFRNSNGELINIEVHTSRDSLEDISDIFD